mgnify:CR=1 FL=1
MLGSGGKIETAGDTMRLTCPECGAQYELPETAIPAAGREVQCSNCGAAWFQAPPEQGAPDPQVAPDAAGTEEAPEAAGPPQRRLDPAVADILRAEADRERSARAAEAAGRNESQPDTTPEAPGPLRRAPEPAAARPAGRTPATGPGTGPALHRDLFPDIEDEAPSWRTADAARASLAPGSAGDTSPEHRGAGFRTGFWLAVSGCALAT